MINATEFLGMSKRRAQETAETKNAIFRLIRIDGESFYDYPSDVRTDRICVEIDNGKVTKAIVS